MNNNWINIEKELPSLNLDVFILVFGIYDHKQIMRGRRIDDERFVIIGSNGDSLKIKEEGKLKITHWTSVETKNLKYECPCFICSSNKPKI